MYSESLRIALIPALEKTRMCVTYARRDLCTEMAMYSESLRIALIPALEKTRMCVTYARRDLCTASTCGRRALPAESVRCSNLEKLATSLLPKPSCSPLLVPRNIFFPGSMRMPGVFSRV